MSQTHSVKGPTEKRSDGCVYLREQVVTKEVIDNYDQIYNWEVKDKDVWVCSLMKSGTTWTQEMVWMIMNDLDFEIGKMNLDERSPYIELSLISSLKNKDPDKLPLRSRDSVKYAKEKSAKETVILKTHFCWNLLPKEIQDGTKKPKIVYVARNPKDVCVSFYHHCRIFHGYPKSLEEFAESFLAGTELYLPYWNHVLPFWEKRNQPNILFIKYEDMIKDLPAVIRQVANFLDKPFRDDQVDILADHLSFSNMKKNPAVNKESSVNRVKAVYSIEGSFIRKGKADGYKDEMSEEMIKKFDEWIKENNTGIDF